MKPAHWRYVWLICLTGICAYFLGLKQKFVSHEIPETDRILFPNLSIDTIEQLNIQTKFGSATLVRDKLKWIYLEKDNYPADGTYINEILFALTDLSITQTETVDVETLHHFGLLDPQDTRDEGHGVRVDIHRHGMAPLSFYIGNMQRSDSEASIMFGGDYDGRQYVRLANSDQVHLVNESLSHFNTLPANWMGNIVCNPHAYRRIEYVKRGDTQWQLKRRDRTQPYQLFNKNGNSVDFLPKLTATMDYAFSSMIIKDVMPANFDPASVKVNPEHYFEIESLDGAIQKIYLGNKTKITKEERQTTDAQTGIIRSAPVEMLRYAKLEWLLERPSPPISGRTYLICCPKMDEYMLNDEEMLILERLNPEIDAAHASL